LLKSDARILIERQSKAKNAIYINGHQYYGYLNGTDVMSWALPDAKLIAEHKLSSNIQNLSQD